MKANFRDRIPPINHAHAIVTSIQEELPATLAMWYVRLPAITAKPHGVTERPLKYRLNEAEKSVRLGDNNYTTEAHHTVLGNQARGTPNFNNFFVNYNIQVVEKANETRNLLEGVPLNTEDKPRIDY